MAKGSAYKAVWTEVEFQEVFLDARPTLDPTSSRVSRQWLLPTRQSHTPPEIQAIFLLFLSLKSLLYRCTLPPETARPTAQTGNLGINEAPARRESTQDPGPNRPLCSIRARSSPRRPLPPARHRARTPPRPRPGGLPGRPPPQLPLRHFSRSGLPPSPLPAQTPSSAGRGKAGRVVAGAVRLHRIRGRLSGPTLPPGPGPRRSPLPPCQGSPCAAHLSQGPAPTQSPPPRQAARVWGAGCKPSERAGRRGHPRPPPHSHLPLQAQGPGRRPPPPLRAPRSDSHRLRCARNRKEASRPPHRCTKRGRGCAGCGTNRSRRRCREGGRRDTARMSSTPPPRPTVVPTQRGRGREEPQPEGRVNTSRHGLRRAPRAPAWRPLPPSATTIEGAAGGWRGRGQVPGSGGRQGRFGRGSGRIPTAPRGVREPSDCSVHACRPRPSWTLRGEELQGPLAGRGGTL